MIKYSALKLIQVRCC